MDACARNATGGGLLFGRSHLSCPQSNSRRPTAQVPVPLTPLRPCTEHAPALDRYELGSEEDDMDAVRRKATALTPRFHVMLVRPLGWAGSALALHNGVGCTLALHGGCWHRTSAAVTRGLLLRACRFLLCCQSLVSPGRDQSWGNPPQPGPLVRRVAAAPSAASAAVCVSRFHPLSPASATLVTLPQTTYDVCLRDTAVLRRFDWSGLVIDEGHSLKGGCIRLRAVCCNSVPVPWQPGLLASCRHPLPGTKAP